MGGSDDLGAIFESRLEDIGRAVALLDTWQNPQYLSRIWCLFEQYVILKKKLPVEFILPTSEAKTFNGAIRERGIDGVRKVIGDVDAENATAWSDYDTQQ